MKYLDHIQGHTFHGRKGEIENAFRYSIDYILCDPKKLAIYPKCFSKNKFNLAGLFTSDHGGEPSKGQGVAWVEAVLAKHGIPGAKQILLLAQPRFWGHVFNPVSFWMCFDTNNELYVVIAEVTNTFGERHSYLCHHDDFGVISKTDKLVAQKIFYVSPFQKIEGSYTFRFDIQKDQIGIWIDYNNGNQGLIATLTGKRHRATFGSLVWSAIRRPFGSRRVQTLIHWQALKLWLKGAKYRVRPSPPSNQVSR